MSGRNKKIYSIVIVGMFGALSALVSAIPIGINIFGVPATLQTFAFALAGFVLGRARGVGATFVYILLGIVGMPVFGGFKSGIGTIFSLTGGFIIGFFGLVWFCGLAKKHGKIWIKIFCALAGLLVCHITGVLWFCFISEMEIYTAVVSVSLPYIVKDVISIIAAMAVSNKIKNSLEILERKV